MPQASTVVAMPLLSWEEKKNIKRTRKKDYMILLIFLLAAESPKLQPSVREKTLAEGLYFYLITEGSNLL